CCPVRGLARPFHFPPPPAPNASLREVSGHRDRATIDACPLSIAAASRGFGPCSLLLYHSTCAPSALSRVWWKRALARTGHALLMARHGSGQGRQHDLFGHQPEQRENVACKARCVLDADAGKRDGSAAGSHFAARAPHPAGL